ncbi:MAG: M50 family metallopeptidase [Actinomycetota bacterium]|nr:M50 family metallopeptidase [Actinomycetota bacterium]
MSTKEPVDTASGDSGADAVDADMRARLDHLHEPELGGHEAVGGRGVRKVLGDPLGIATRNHDDEDDQEPLGTKKEQRFALIRLVVVIAAIITAGYAAGVGETVLLIGAFFVCIMLHELGHFVTAKSAGIKVTEFFVGFGPRLWSVRRGETEYGVKALPLGGYCRIIGMHNLDAEVDPADEDRTYRAKSMWRRLSVAVAGSAVHFLIAIVVLFAMFAGPGDNGNYLPTPATNPIVDVSRLTTGPSPAAAAGFRLGDRIESVDGRTFPTFPSLTSYVQARPGQTLDVVVDRQGHLVHLHPTTVDLSKVTVAGAPGTNPAPTTKPTGFLGIAPSPVVHSSVAGSFAAAGGAFVHASALTLSAFGHLVTLHGVSSYVNMLSSRQAATSPNAERFVSPVGVVSLFHQAGRDGLGTVLFLLAIINISLGIFNLVPLLPLDGGHVAIALYEGARSRKGHRYHANVGKLVPLLYLAIAGIAFLGLTSLYLDLRYPLA